MKFGAYEYKTENIGDEIQTIAALRFIPQVDYWVDRDNIDGADLPDEEIIKLIANGWYMHASDGKFCWPPKKANLDMLITSIYIEHDNPDNPVDAVFFAKDSMDFLKKHEPIGARDLGTLRLLEKHGITAFFSGCMTLTLLPDKTVPKRDYILAVDVSDELYHFLVKETKRVILRLNTNHMKAMTGQNKRAMAKYWLTLYQSAHCVVTPRLHATLPCLALGTPVLAIRKNDKRRFEGLIELSNNCPEKKLITKEYKYDFEKPKANPEEYRKIANKLVRECQKFTGYDSKKSYLGDESWTEFLKSTNFIEMITGMAEDGFQYSMLQLHAAWLEQQLQKTESLNQQMADRNWEAEQQIAKLQSELQNMGIRQSASSLRKAILRKLS